MRKLNVIQIGTGHAHAGMAMRSLRRQSDIFNVLGYVEPQGFTPGENYEGLKEYSLEEAFAIPDLDAAIVETDEKELTKYAMLAAQRGLAVYMDKPGGDVPEEFEAFIDYVEAHKTVFSTGYMYRYSPAVKELMRMVKAGELGEITHVEAQMNCVYGKKLREWLGRYQGGMMFFLGCHLVDLILRIQGEPLEIIPFNHASNYEDIHTNDCGFAVFKYPNGVSFAKTTTVEIGGFYRRQLVVSGTKGTVEINPIEYYAGGDVSCLKADMYVTTLDDYKEKGWAARGEKRTFGPFDRYNEMLADFARAVRGEPNQVVAPEEERRVYRAVMKACGKDLK
jgi:predicted dehydrogenase